ncbi:MAG: CoA transferase [Chloroflexi bacterium]|nr:CoA transferase [Chloroflexota bacterium]
MVSSEVRLPLAGVRVLDLTHHTAGDCVTMPLARWGADVIKVERPGRGDDIRYNAPIVSGPDGEQFSVNFLRVNINKRSISLDLKKETGRELFWRLLSISDVLCENFTPGTMEKLGLGYEALRRVNPRIIYASLSGFGQPDVLPSPWWNRRLQDIVGQGMGGIMEMTGQSDGPPTETGVPIGDLVTAINTVLGVMTALYLRAQTGEGQRVDVAMYDSMVAMAEGTLCVYSFTGEKGSRGSAHRAAPYSAFRCRDGWVVIQVSTNEIWGRFCQAIGRPDLVQHPLLANGKDRAMNQETMLRPLIEGWLVDKMKAEASELLVACDVPAGPVQDQQELLDSPQLWARRMFVEIEDPVAGRGVVVSNPVKLAGYGEAPGVTAPRVGQHTEEILTELLGLGPEDIARLRAEGAI